jgi:ferrous-iron efflux pump FieF
MLRNDKIIKFISIAVVFINLLLIASKGLIYFNTYSVAVFSSLIDSIFDLILSSINGLTLLYSMKPKDDNHRFGHGAIEDVISLFQIVLIAIASVMVFYNSVHLTPEEYHFSWKAVGFMLANILPLSVIIFLQTYAQKKSGSTIIKADLLHYSSDFLTTLSVVSAMILSYFTKILWFDILCGAVIMLAILYSCIGGAVQAFNNLMARELQDGTREAVEAILTHSKDIISFKDLRTRGSGQMRFIQVDVILHSRIALKDAHEIAHKLEDTIKDAIQNVDVIIHMEPAV